LVGFRTGFHNGFRTGFHNGFHNGFRTGFYNGFRTGFHNGFRTGFRTGFYNGFHNGFHNGNTGLRISMASLPAGFLLIFLDGLGLGTPGPQNPLSCATMPFLSQYLQDQPLYRGAAVNQAKLLLRAVDATLGVAGLPQSATGQTTIYTGQNAPRFLGRHQSGFANGSLRSLIDEYGLLRQAMALGFNATLANAYSPGYFYAIAQRKRRYSVCTLLNMAAGLTFRMQYEYEAEQALFWDIVGEVPPALNSHSLSQHGARLPISPAVAGARLARLSANYGVTVFESYLLDYAGHGQNWERAVAYLQRIDGFLESAIAHLPPQVTLIMVSDHGNVEDLSTSHHTLNAVPLLAVGPQAVAFSSVEDLTGVTPTILSLLAASASSD
jgi:2,3-bisphosphoglycerate-independent phosphoglycerate mutase